MEETLRALDDLVRQGKVRYLGVSNHPAWRVADAQWLSRHHGLNAFVSCQDEYSLLVRGAERELIPAAKSFGMGLLPYFPLASGLLTGKYARDAVPGAETRFGSPSMGRLGPRYMTEANWPIVDALAQFAAKRGHAILDLAFAWLLADPVVPSVIAGATTAEQVEQNVRSAEWALSAEEKAEVDKLSANRANRRAVAPRSRDPCAPDRGRAARRC